MQRPQTKARGVAWHGHLVPCPCLANDTSTATRGYLAANNTSWYNQTTGQPLEGCMEAILKLLAWGAENDPSLRVTPAMAAGILSEIWPVDRLLPEARAA